jgi:hypothetical protein
MGKEQVGELILALIERFPRYACVGEIKRGVEAKVQKSGRIGWC